MASKAVIHIGNKAHEFVADLKKNGFNGARFCLAEVADVNSLQDWLDDGHMAEEHEEFVSNYAMIRLFPLRHETENHYCQFNYHQYWIDMEKRIKEVFGSDVSVKQYWKTNEFEITRKTQSIE